MGTWAEGAQILPCSLHLNALDLGDAPVKENWMEADRLEV